MITSITRHKRVPSKIKLSFTIILISTVVFVPITVVGQNQPFEMAGEDSVELPARTVTFQGAEYNVSHASIINRSDSVVLNITAPPDKGYQIFLYDRKRRIVDAKFGSGSRSITFTNLDFPPGSYMFVLQHKGVTQTIHPLVIRSHRLAITSVTPLVGAAFNVTLTVTQIENTSVSTIEVGLGRNNTHRRALARQLSETRYAARINGSGLPAGKYTVSAVARGRKTAFDSNQKQLLGVARPRTYYFDGTFPSNGTVMSVRTNTPTWHTRDNGSNLITPKSRQSANTTDETPTSPLGPLGYAGIGLVAILLGILVWRGR